MNIKIDMKIYRILPPFNKLECIYKKTSFGVGYGSYVLFRPKL